MHACTVGILIIIMQYTECIISIFCSLLLFYYAFDFLYVALLMMFIRDLHMTAMVMKQE